MDECTGVILLHGNLNVHLRDGFLLTNPRTFEYLSTLYQVVDKAETVIHLSILPHECPHNFAINYAQSLTLWPTSL